MSPVSCDRRELTIQNNLNNTVMLVNSIRVYQLSGSPSNVVGEARGNSNLTGAGGAIPIDRPDGNDGSKQVGEMGVFLVIAMLLGVSFGYLSIP